MLVAFLVRILEHFAHLRDRSREWNGPFGDQERAAESDGAVPERRRTLYKTAHPQGNLYTIVGSRWPLGMREQTENCAEDEASSEIVASLLS
jgi:hypothetical protein